jgi:hypothetical protein
MDDAMNGYKDSFNIPFRSAGSPNAKTITARTFPSLKVTQTGGKRASFKKSVGSEFKKIAKITERYVRSDLKAPPRRAGKINWSSRVQAYAFYQTNGFGKGIPTKRTNTVEKKWFVDVKQTARNKQRQSYIFALENTDPKAPFVYGGFTAATNFQQFFHFERGWTNILGYDERLYNKIILPQLIFVFENRFKDIEALLRSDIAGVLAKAGAAMRKPTASSEDFLTDPYATNTRRVLSETGGLSGLFESLETFLE